MKPLISVLIVFCSMMFSFEVAGQTFEEFKKQREKELQDFKNRQTQAMKQLQEEYDNYVRERDKEFTEYLEKEWEQFEVFKGVEPPDEPKPDVVPKYEPVENEEREGLPIKELPAVKAPLIPVQRKVPENIKPVIQKSQPVNIENYDLSFSFYGFPVMLNFDQALQLNSPAEIKYSTVAKWWKEASETGYTSLVNKLFAYKKMMNLNDWGYYKLLKKTSEKIQSDDPNGTNLLTWFLLTRSGYNAKISYYGDKTSVIVPCQQMMYGRRYINLKGINYYMIDEIESNTIRTYAIDYYDATRHFDLHIDRPLNLGGDPIRNNLTLKSGNERHEIQVSCDKFVVDFYKDYPQTDLQVYFDAPVSRETKESISLALLPLMEGKSDREKINLLLSFVQNAFEYKVDKDHFGKEKFLFPEETLFYKYSDCEDRSVLFAYLVKELTDNKIIGIKYDGHVATAVHFSDSSSSEGNYYIFNDEKYVIADPTYIDAPAGLAMPQYRASRAQLIKLSTVNYLGTKILDYWEIAGSLGGYRGSNLDDIAYDTKGNIYLTGYFKNAFRLSDSEMIEGDGDRTAFTACINKEGDIKWAYAPEGENISAGYALTLDNEKNILVSGSFSGTLYLGGFTLQTSQDKPDVFVTKLDPEGRLMWAAQAGLDELDHRSYMKYILKYDRNGNKIDTELYLEDEQTTADGIFTDEDGINYIAGTFHGTTGFNSGAEQFMDISRVDYVELLKTESDALLLEDVDEGIVGVFAAINLIKNNGTMISGSMAQEALDRYNPEFKSNSSHIYKKLGKIDFIKNSEGIIEMSTQNSEPVVIDRIKIHNGSSVKIKSELDGNERLDILSGIEVGKLFLWYDLNYVKMFRDSGNLLFDYDDDHTQATVNIRDDILE